ncbi:hypothetical protein N9933_03430 [bacterium]|nr:hypothetical protein [bacterium]
MNAKEEFLEVARGRSVICASISNGGYYSDDGERRSINLKKGHSQEDYDKFKSAINFSYNSVYGRQELRGMIWFNDGTWAERVEYNGTEWWEYREVPQIPNELQNS